MLGSLLEKEQTNPETVPMTINALILACNQKTNREPVMQLTEDQVVSALDWMRQEVLAWRSEGARTERWQQSVSRRWGLDRAGKALITLLLLRGAQTAGELRTRSERLHPFASLEEAEEALRHLAAEDEPLVTELPAAPARRRPAGSISSARSPRSRSPWRSSSPPTSRPPPAPPSPRGWSGWRRSWSGWRRTWRSCGSSSGPERLPLAAGGPTGVAQGIGLLTRSVLSL